MAESLCPRTRFGILTERLDLLFKRLEYAEYKPAGQVRARRVFGGKKANAISKIASPKNRDYAWHAEYAEAMVLWLRQEMGYEHAPRDLFTAPVANEEDLIRYLHGGVRLPAGRDQLPRYSCQEEQALALTVKRMLVSIDDPEYFRKTEDLPAGVVGVDAAAMNRFVVAGGTLLPAPELAGVGNLLRLCIGCGRGADEFRLFEAVFEEHWKRRHEVIIGLDREEHFAGLASIGARTVQGKLLDGNFSEARVRAAEIDDWAEQGLLGADGPALARLRTRLTEALVHDETRAASTEKLSEHAALVFGKLSEGHITAMKCRACRAVSVCAQDAEDRIRCAKEAIAEAEARFPHRADETTNHKVDLGFIELIHLERTHQDEPRRHVEALKEKLAADDLQWLNRRMKAPLRKAKLLHWLWKATGRSRQTMLETARRLAGERPSVRKLCVFDVGAFRTELEQEFGSLSKR